MKGITLITFIILLGLTTQTNTQAMQNSSYNLLF